MEEPAAGSELAAEWSHALGVPVVLDLASQYVILGTLDHIASHFVTLVDADVHDLRDSKTTRELYVIEARRHGVRSNRTSVCVRIGEIVSFSRLDAVVE